MKKVFISFLLVFIFSCQKEKAEPEYSEVQISTTLSSEVSRVRTSGFTTAGSTDTATGIGFTKFSSTFDVVKLSGNYNIYEVYAQILITGLFGTLRIQIGYHKYNNKTSFFHDIVWSTPIPYRVINGAAIMKFGTKQTFQVYQMDSDPNKWRTRIDTTDIFEFDVREITTARSPLCGVAVTANNVSTPTFNFAPALTVYKNGWKDVTSVRVIHVQPGIGVKSTAFNNIDIGSAITTTNLNLY